MKLYDAKMAPNPRRVRIFMAEKGIEAQTIQVDIMAKEMQSAEFTSKNPWQRLPVLELDDGTCIAETVAICRYLEEIQPEPPLMGRDARDKGLVEMWNRRVEQGLFAAIVAVFRHTNPAMAALEVPQVADWGKANRPKVEAALTMLDKRLGEAPFIVGESLTIADITALCAVDFAKIIGMRLGDDTPHAQRWHAAMAARPSYRA